MPRAGVAYALKFEAMEAAHWAHFRRFADFCELSGDEQSLVVAHYRTHMQIEAVIAWRGNRKNNR